jgi:hypothetical protein
MRRRQLFAERAQELIAEEEAKRINEEKERRKMGIKVPNSNIISKTAQPALKEKANMFLPHEKDIKLPNGKKAPAKRKGR